MLGASPEDTTTLYSLMTGEAEARLHAQKEVAAANDVKLNAIRDAMTSMPESADKQAVLARYYVANGEVVNSKMQLNAAIRNYNALADKVASVILTIPGASALVSPPKQIGMAGMGVLPVVAGVAAWEAIAAGVFIAGALVVASSELRSWFTKGDGVLATASHSLDSLVAMVEAMGHGVSQTSGLVMTLGVVAAVLGAGFIGWKVARKKGWV